ncbi:hypothetical protein FEM48_Zijuj12G0016100 [Ziziphus jujuba var. spinosa]|uniref:Kinesin motor domain-containing protein n=1 Tax=Ziziphus jujuba var. spinosa TaxID=714518 RepID=A0A978UAF9_ZIZJJ|nr:hypothetical protein FEM48_Zijuj12G0016100 [Ziziphus jujuba var. spinosa]
MDRIHVAVRARPLSPEDAKTSPWRISANSIFIPSHSSKFEFDRIFGEDCKTIDVYQARTKEIVAAAVRGTVFAYGQTNSGKTYTMRGSAMEPGVIPLAVSDMFNAIHENSDREFLLRMSYMEIYNEEINDLLAPEHRKLQIHENLERGIYVAGLREEIVATPEQVLDLMEFGESHRHIGETNMNLHSSRSHTIFRMIIESRDKTEDEDANACDAVRVSVLNLVDLAGSERAAKTGAEGVRLKEGSHINKSLMTLGTVIKKLSEGAESQGSHVPYRDSKLTRILQPALGGNANTAMICNITLAQIHADETKSSLQFASRALRVTNCAHVNEILTDAALLKRQKKEIEELRSKLQGSHSEHLEEEILNLRNTLLQTELERERIALELEEEKKAQAEWERMVQQQAKQIENLSSMVLYSNREENRDRPKKEKRRDTWCAGNLSRETLVEVYSTIQSKASAMKPMKRKRDMGPLLPFEELVNGADNAEEESRKQDEYFKTNTSEDCNLPDPCALLHITNRRKVPLRKKGLPMDNELAEMQAEYEDLLIRFESQRTESEIQIDYLTRKLAEAHSANYLTKGTTRESEAILVIKRLQEQIKMLEMEKSSSQQNLDSIVDLAMEQNICAREKFEELYEELVNAREEARVAHEQLASNESEGCLDSEHKLFKEVQEIVMEVQNSKVVIDSISSLMEDVSRTFSGQIETFLDFKTLMCQYSLQVKSIIRDQDKLNSCIIQKVSELENQKRLLYNQSVELQNQIEELKLDAQNSAQSLREVMEQRDSERGEYLSHIQVLEKEISRLSSCSLAREKETLRKDLEKTKTKLKETEFKLKNAMQEKTKIEGEKAFAEREIKRLHGQNSLLERDINKRESLAGKRRDSISDKGSKIFDPKKAKGLAAPFEQTLQEEYKKMEVYAFEMETRIVSLEEELSAAVREKEETLSKNDDLTSELEDLSEKLNISNLELKTSQEEVAALRLTDSLLEMEEERAVWSAKEKASVRNELESFRQECKVLKEKLTCSREEAERDKICSIDKTLGVDKMKNKLKIDELGNNQSQEDLKNQLLTMAEERDKLITQVHKQQSHAAEVEFLKTQAEELNRKISSMEVKMHKDQVDNGKEMAKLRMRLKWTHAREVTFKNRYMEVMNESDHMNKKYEEAAAKLKERLVSKGTEVLNLKKQLSTKGQ